LAQSGVRSSRGGGDPGHGLAAVAFGAQALVLEPENYVARG